MIAGTCFEPSTFEDVWAIAGDYAGRWIDAAAMREAMGDNAVCLACPDGVVSMSLVPDEGGRMRAFVLMAVSTCFAGAFRRNEADVLEIARSMGAHRLAFRSNRRGWIKLLGPEWTRTGDTYERGL